VWNPDLCACPLLIRCLFKTHNEDIVPKLPGYALGFAHISSEYWITTPNDVAVTTADIQVSSGAYNFAGNKGTLGLNPDEHNFYFNDISACGPGFEFP
jgi:hypothetical protein